MKVRRSAPARIGRRDDARIVLADENADYLLPRTSSFKTSSGPVPFTGGTVLESVHGTKLTAHGESWRRPSST